MRTNNEVSDQKPSVGETDSGYTPAGLFAGETAGSGCGGKPGLDQDPTATFSSEGGYHPFSEASLDPQYSQDMAGLQINDNLRHNSRPSCSLASSREEGSSAGGCSADTAIGRDNERGGDGSVAAEPRSFSLSGGGYSPFSSATLVSSGSSNSMPKPPDTPLTTTLAGYHSGQGTSVSPAAGGGGSGDHAGRRGSGQERRAPHSTPGELERRLDGVKAPLENGVSRENGTPTPLSPDALTPFSRGDPEAKDRDR